MTDVRKSFPIYLACSIGTAALEFVLGWCLLQLFPNSIVLTNIAAILVSSVVHYALTTKFAFGAKRNVSSALVYAATFVLGLILQNLVIWVSYEMVFSSIDQLMRYGISKALSLGIPFFVLFFIRKTLNERLANQEEPNDDPGE